MLPDISIKLGNLLVKILIYFYRHIYRLNNSIDWDLESWTTAILRDGQTGRKQLDAAVFSKTAWQFADILLRLLESNEGT